MKKQEINTRIGSLSCWAYAFGCAVGWGSFMMPSNTFLPGAGPLGSLIGIIISAVLIALVAKSTAYMAKAFPKEAGIHVYIDKILGADHGFLSSWAVLLAYLSIIWANATALIILIRAIFGDVLQFGFHYTVAEYDVYAGEILFTIAVFVLFGVLAMIGKTAIRVFHVILALLHIGLIIAIFVGIFIGGNHSETFGFASTDMSPPVQTFNIIMLAPWMYVGFEAFMYMFNSGGRSSKNVNKITIKAVITIAIAYILPILIPVFGLPEGYSSWEAYISASGDATGLFSVPVFYSTYYLLGKPGLYLLVACIICAVSTSLFGLYRATSRVLVSMAEEDIMPSQVKRTNKSGEPYVAIIIIMLISCIIPFVGRTAVVWIVDITTIAATIVYVYSMIGALKLSRNDAGAGKGIKAISIIGLIFALASFLFLLIPTSLSFSSIATESYFILAIWSLVGMIFYWYVYNKDKKGIYGKTPIMWMFMSFLILFSAVMWIRQRTINDIDVESIDKATFDIHNNENAIMLVFVVIVVLIVLYSLFNILLKRQKEAERNAVESESRSEAKTAFLFNMSHDIRTPMNAILGFTDLALVDPGNEEKIKEYLGKIKQSGNHLLSLINDILEMSRIESGKVDINTKADDLEQIFGNIESIMRGSAEAKGQEFIVDTSGVEHRYIYVDRLRINQVLLNLISNAIKYTQDGGKIEVIANELGVKDNRITYNFCVKDNGFGMSEEFAAKIFDSFEREEKKETEGIQGTGLGMAITKNVIDIMDGEITLKTKENEGSRFDVKLTFKEADEDEIRSITEVRALDETDFEGKRVLLADDMEINREIAVAILELYGFEVVQAVDGQDALTKVVTHPAGYFDIIFMDIQMPKMSGYEASMAIRNISDKQKANVPIIAMTANAFESDVQDALNAGMNGHVAKPIDQEKLVEEIKKVLTLSSVAH